MSQTHQIKVSDKAQGIIERQIDNNVTGRKEITLKIFHIGSPTPSREELKKALASYLGQKEDLLVIRKITTGYGAGISQARIHVYTDPKNLEKYEPKHLLVRGTKQNKGGESNG
jgi:SSU ribosomal protein S24E